MDIRSLCRICMVIVLILNGATDAAWTLTASSEFAVVGESFILTCNPHNSTANLISWKRLDIDTSSTGTSRAVVEANGCTVGQGSDTQYQYTCEPGPIYKLTIPASVMTIRQNNTVWRCEYALGGDGADYTVTVAIPVSNISVQESPTGNQQINVIPVYENTPKTIYCITTRCRPQASVTVTTTGVIKGQFTEDFIPQYGDLTITRVSQVITTTRGGNTTKTIQCSAVNIQGRPPVISQLATIVVYYIPSVEPTLTGYTNGTILYVGDNDITLTCQQSGGYPLSVITWACDGQTGTANNSQTVASSFVRITVNKNLNGRMCACTVRHPDNNLAYTRSSSVTFTVYYAAWTLTASSEFAVVGESFILTCNPHNSTANLISWKRLDIDTSSTGTSRAVVEANGCTVGQGSDTQYQYTCEPGPIYKLTIPASVMTIRQNNTVWRCEYALGGDGADYTVTVAIPVSNISVQESPTGNQQINVIPVYENTPKTIYCITTRCRPQASVTVTTTGVIKGQFTEDFIPQYGDLTITRVSQVITTTRGGNTTKTIQCSAVNIQGRPPVISQLATIVVYYIPSVEPTLTGYTNGTILYVGDNDITLTCQQSGGYPLSVITWACDGQTGTANNSQTVASSFVRITVNKNLNGRMCACTVRHPDNNLAYTRSSSVTFTVYYPPTTPSLQTFGASFSWIENTQGVLKCVTTAGFPTATTYEWSQNGQVINGKTSETFTIPTLSDTHNGIQIQCRVSNGYTVQKHLAIISNTLILDVQYTPIITLDTTNITIQEGSSRSRPCSAVGNPTPTVKWYRENSVQTSGRGNSSTLVFSNIDRNQTDTYICRATSTGIRNFVSSKSVSVIVYYPPVVTVTLHNTTENATNAVLTCNADGFPRSYTYHGWTQYIGNTLVRSYTDFNGILSERNKTITIPKVTFEDTGRYYCNAENGIQGRQPAVLQQGFSYFNVRASAKFDPNKEARKIGELHKNFTISIKFYSNPPAVKSNVKWINKTTGTEMTDSGIISLSLISTPIQRSIYGKTVTLPGQSAMLNIASFQSFYIGHYTLQINNGGSLTSSFDFEIITSAPPEPPSEFRVLENKTNSVILTWKKGYNGGQPQTFVIRYTDTVTGRTIDTKIKDRNQNLNYSTEIDELNPNTIYLFWIYSTNKKDNSTMSVTPLIGKTLKEAVPENQSGNVGAVVGGVTGVLAIFIVVVIVGIMIYRRKTRPEIKSNVKIQDDRQVNNAYEDLNDRVVLSEVSTYQVITKTDNASAVYVNDINTYEGLDKTKQQLEANTYETLKDEQLNEDQIEKVYVNTTIGLVDGRKQ